MYKVDHSESSDGTYLKGYIIALPKELIKLFGEPVDPNIEGSTMQWTFIGTEEGHDDELEIFTIYSWHTNKKFMWSVGAKSPHTEFISWVYERLDEWRNLEAKVEKDYNDAILREEEK